MRAQITSCEEQTQCTNKQMHENENEFYACESKTILSVTSNE